MFAAIARFGLRWLISVAGVVVPLLCGFGLHSVSFMVLTVILGAPGKFVALVILILQLITAGRHESRRDSARVDSLDA